MCKTYHTSDLLQLLQWNLPAEWACKRLIEVMLPFAGYTLAPSGTVDNFSDSGHSEISSRSSIVSNSSFDSMPASLHDERRQRHSVSIVETNLGVGRIDRRIVIEPDQYSLG